MSNGKYVIDKIRRQVSITQYLQKRGIQPTRQDHAGGVKDYICPIHKDSDPSFRVWDSHSGKFDYQNFKCFGCGCGNDIIALHAAMQCDKNYGRAIKQLAGQVDVSIQGEIDFVLRDLKVLGGMQQEQQIQMLSLKISSSIYSYLQLTQFDPKQVQFVASVMKVIDAQITNFNTTQVSQAYQFLSTQGAIRRRYANWLQQKKLKQIIRIRSNND